MDACMFCGSPSAPWPENASDYVRGYNLCEFHIYYAVKSATMHRYDPAKEALFEASKKLCDSINEHLELWREKNDPEELTQDNKLLGNFEVKIFDYVWEQVCNATPIDKGDPVETWIDDQAFDTWLTNRITHIAREGGYSRCEAARPDSPDGRCTRKAEGKKRLCQRCSSEKAKSFTPAERTEKLKQALEVLRSD